MTRVLTLRMMSGVRGSVNGLLNFSLSALPAKISWMPRMAWLAGVLSSSAISAACEESFSQMSEPSSEMSKASPEAIVLINVAGS